jgi:hypothetical protein
MNELDWKLAEGFSQHENWGNADKMDISLLWLLTELRRRYKAKYDAKAYFVIHNGYETKGHKETGYHPRGLATDFHIVTKLTFVKQMDAIDDIFADMEITQFVGLGVYPDWNNPGFHLDSRGEIGRWGRIESKKGQYIKELDAAVPENGYVKLTIAYDYAKLRGI